MIKQSSLQKFQDEMGAVQKDPYRVVMRQTKLPMSLLHDRVKAHVSIKQDTFSFCFRRLISLASPLLPVWRLAFVLVGTAF